ncbi:MAG: cytochrome c oxidase subunit 3 [Phycisphaerales bacterium]|nr:cytochrome c oxidase subunit 3 [Phycisphaerales bacterium]
MPRTGTVMAGTDPAVDPRGVFDNPDDRRSAARFALWLLCIVLGMLFGGVIVALLVLRFDGAAWPSDLPRLPWQLWLSTGLLLMESVALVLATRRTSSTRRRLLVLAFVLAIGFIATQVWAWWDWHASVDLEARRTAVAALWVVGGVHVAHVLGGLVPLGLVLWGATTMEWSDRQNDRLRLTATYWHFLDAVWIAMMLTLLIVL